MRKAGLLASTVQICKIHDVVDFFTQHVTEWNVNYDDKGEELVNTVAARVNQDAPHTASWTVQEMLGLLAKGKDRERHEYYSKHVLTEHIHDFHYPDPTGPPNPSQPCARLLKGTTNMYYCANGYPRDLVSQPSDQSVAQDPMRKELWRCHLCRNYTLMNSHMPPVSFFAQSNTDAQPVVTKHQAEMYLCKYCSKNKKLSGARQTLYDVLEDMEAKNKAASNKIATAAADSGFEAKLGPKLHKTFMAEIGEEMVQDEVAHHANKCPEYFCSRPVKYVHIYKKALGISTRRDKAQDDQEQGGPWSSGDEEQGEAWSSWKAPAQTARRVTQKSDVELYESRSLYPFAEDAGLSIHLPAKGTPEQQVADASLFDFFRLVRFHGGYQPYLSWHKESAWPILIMSPVLKLTEGPSFAFGARWALMQYHVWHDRREFLDASEEDIKQRFRDWVDTSACPWYLREEYAAANNRKRRVRRGSQKPADAEQGEGDADGEGALGSDASESEATSEDVPDAMADADEDTHVLKMLYKGNMQESNRKDLQHRKTHCAGHKHNVYRNTRCTSVAQEEQSALPAGVINTFEDSEDEGAYFGEQLEIQRECDQLRAVESWINQEGWDLAAEGRALSPKTGEEVDLRLPWDEVKKKLQPAAQDPVTSLLKRSDVERDYDLEKLDPTQRAFADRVLRWATELADVYKENQKRGSAGKWRKPPRLRTWLCGSAGSGKSTTLKTVVQHVRLLFQEKDIDAAVELTAFTGVAAFNIGFGAKTACSSFSISGDGSWQKELKGDKARRLEEQWRSVALLIVDEISFIGSAFFWRMHLRMQQGRSRYYSEAGLNPHDDTFGGASVILVGDFGQLEPIDDLSMVDKERQSKDLRKDLRWRWGHMSMGRRLVSEFKEAFMLNKIHRSKDDLWWTESCLRLRDFMCTKQEDYDAWMLHDLDRGHLSEEQKKYFEDEAVWLCARCEDVGARNGRKLREIVQQQRKVLHRIRADHQGSKHARKQPAKAFEGLRDVVHLVRGCKVMLTRNVAYNFGLANGTRGTLVGIVYGPKGFKEMPEAIVLHVEDYTGPAFYPQEPKWVPILPMTSVKEGTRMMRTQFPVVAGFALTVNKAQGLTLKEGVVIHLRGGARFRPAAMHGLPFVAWTRSESFDMTAFKNLPPWNDFVKGKESDMLRMRQAFVDDLWKKHRQTMAKHSKYATRMAEERAFDSWKARREAEPAISAHEPVRMHCQACAELAEAE